ncbi:MAG TPA: pyridoxamine 5'-phosphate oxidase family protein, partial [Dehalococcoidia bacterium]|nr:pyridoxamine 5'-phosphate oxidase family protein [Dehalococcoidia bacterium]
AVLERVSGVWPSTSIYYQGGWTEPQADGDKLKVSGLFPALGAAPACMNLTFSFNGAGQISHVQQEMITGGPPQTVEEIPQHVRGQIDGALANGTPLCVTYVDENGQPQSSLRGSTVVYSPTQLAIWLRNAEGGLTKALTTNDKVSLLYRDSKTRSTVVVQGRAHIATDEETRRRVYEKTPEVEQFHDTGRKGAALIIDITRLQAGGPKGNFRMQK